MVSFGSVLSGMVAVMLLSIYGYFFITYIQHPIYRDMRLLILLLFLAGVRMLVPFNLPVNITIRSTRLLVPASNIAFMYVIDDTVYFYQVLFCIFCIISIILLSVKAYKYMHFISEVNRYTYHDTDLDKLLSERTLNLHPSTVTALYTNAHVSPFVYGIFKKTIIIPDDTYHIDEIKLVLDHELTHINQHDLLIKTAFNCLTALFWWNPFMWLIRKHADSAIEISNDVSLYNTMNEQEKADYASLLVKTAGLSKYNKINPALSLASHNDPLIKRRVKQILSASSIWPKSIFLPFHILVMVFILAASFIVTPEPYEIYEKDIEDSYNLERDKGSTKTNTYIIDAGDHYELYIEDELIGKMENIPDEFKDYPVYKEKPEDGK